MLGSNYHVEVSSQPLVQQLSDMRIEVFLSTNEGTGTHRSLSVFRKFGRQLPCKVVCHFLLLFVRECWRHC